MFIGLDFGTSNTSVSFIDEASIQIFERRSQERYWNELSDLASLLPYPVAAPLAQYLCQSDAARLAAAAREVLESALTLAAYTAYLEFCSLKGRAETALLKNLTKKSAGPLWNLLQRSLEQIRGKGTLSNAYQELLEPELFMEINTAVSTVAQYKHGKASEQSANVLHSLQILANVTHKAFSKAAFGIFQQVQKQRFSVGYEGIFRHAHGNPPFIETSPYSGSFAFSNNECHIVARELGIALPLEPLILWEPCAKHPDLENGHCYLLDTAEKDGSFTYKAVGHTCELTISASGSYPELSSRLRLMLAQDMTINPLQIGPL